MVLFENCLNYWLRVMKFSKMDAWGASVFVIGFVWLVALPKWQFDKNIAEAQEFCEAVKGGVMSSEVIALANAENRSLRKYSNKMEVYFGSGCRCSIGLEGEKSAQAIAWCRD